MNNTYQYHPNQANLVSNRISNSQQQQQQQPNSVVRQINTSIDTSRDDDDYDECESDAEENYLYLSVELTPQVAEKLRTVSQDQYNFLKQLGVLSIQCENQTYGLNLTSPKRRATSTAKETTTTKKDENQPTAAPPNPSSSSFAYIPTSGLIIDEPSHQYGSVNYTPPGDKQQFTMPCPMLKNLLKNEGGSQQIEAATAQSDEVVRIMKLRQSLANQTTSEPSTTTSDAAQTPAKKTRNRTPSDKPKQKRAPKASKIEQTDGSEANSNKKDHLPQEKIRNILNEAQNYHQMNQQQMSSQAPAQQTPPKLAYQIPQHQMQQPPMQQQQQQQLNHPQMQVAPPNAAYQMNMYGSEQMTFVAHHQQQQHHLHQHQPAATNLVNNTNHNFNIN